MAKSITLTRGGFGTIQIKHGTDPRFEKQSQAGGGIWMDLREAKKKLAEKGFEEIEFIENPGAQRPRTRIIRLNSPKPKRSTTQRKINRSVGEDNDRSQH